MNANDSRPFGFLGTCKPWTMVTSDPSTQQAPESEASATASDSK